MLIEHQSKRLLSKACPNNAIRLLFDITVIVIEIVHVDVIIRTDKPESNTLNVGFNILLLSTVLIKTFTWYPF